MTNLKGVLSYFNTLIIYLVVALLPIFFTPLTTEYFETGKLLLVATLVTALLLILGLKLVTENKITLVKTPLDILLALYLLVVVISTVLSSTPFTGLFGNLPKIQGSLISQITVILLYFCVVIGVKSVRQTLIITQLLTFSGLFMATLSLLAYFKVFLPWKAAALTNFSLAGSPSSATILLAILLPLSLVQLFSSAQTKITKINIITIFYFLSSLIFTITIVLTGNIASWVGALFGAALVIYSLIYKTEDKRVRINSLVASIIGILGFISLLLLILSYTPTLKNATIFGKLASEFNREIQMPLSTSWKVSAGAFRDSPILGTGPASYLYDFTQYKPIEYNKNSFWNVRLNTAHNQYLQTWAELGGAGIILLLLIALTVIFFAFKHQDPWGLGISGVTFFVTMAFFPASFLVQSVGVLLVALFMISSLGRGRVQETVIDFSGRTVSGAPGSHFLIPSLLFLPILILILVAFIYPGFLTKFALGEYYNRQALNALSGSKGLDAYNSLIKAERVNPQVDSYRASLAQTNFALANSIASQKGPTEASPGGSLTDTDKTNIQQLLQQAIAEGRAAVTLSPKSAANWEILALIYRQISGVAQNAVTFSLDAYGKAIALDPLNPLLRLAVGGVYYQAKNYDLAVRFFDDTVALKPDYANGLYNLAIALRDKGNLTEGISIAEKLVAQLQDKPDSEDYKTASKLLNELKEKTPSQTQPPAATPSAALENDQLPKVLDLPKPEQVSTPAAVNK